VACLSSSALSSLLSSARVSGIEPHYRPDRPKRSSIPFGFISTALAAACCMRISTNGSPIVRIADLAPGQLRPNWAICPAFLHFACRRGLPGPCAILFWPRSGMVAVPWMLVHSSDQAGFGFDSACGTRGSGPRPHRRTEPQVVRHKCR
jgi:hypothetical protein